MERVRFDGATESNPLKKLHEHQCFTAPADFCLGIITIERLKSLG
jgi:hypothetical protein